MGEFYEAVDKARVQALAFLATELRGDQDSSALCHLAEALMMQARERAGSAYVRAWLEKIDAHLDNDLGRACRAIIDLKERSLR